MTKEEEKKDAAKHAAELVGNHPDFEQEFIEQNSQEAYDNFKKNYPEFLPKKEE